MRKNVKETSFTPLEELLGEEIDELPLMIKEKIKSIHFNYAGKINTNNDKRWREYNEEIDNALADLGTATYKGKTGIDYLIVTIKAVNARKFIESRLTHIYSKDSFYH